MKNIIDKIVEYKSIYPQLCHASNIIKIYVLRKTTRKAGGSDVAEDVVLRLFHDIKSHLEQPWSDVRHRLMHDGVII